MIKIMRYGEVANEEIFARSTPTVDVAGIVSGITWDSVLAQRRFDW